MDETFADVLTRVMDVRQHSQRKVADTVGVDRSRVSEWKRGVGVPSPRTLERFANAYGLDLDRLMRLCGHHDSAADQVADPELDEVAARFKGAVRGVSRVYWSAVIEASIALAEKMPQAEAVTNPAETPVTDRTSTVNLQEDSTKPRVSGPQPPIWCPAAERQLVAA